MNNNSSVNGLIIGHAQVQKFSWPAPEHVPPANIGKCLRGSMTQYTPEERSMEKLKHKG